MFMRISVKGKTFCAGLVVTMVTDNLYAPGEALVVMYYTTAHSSLKSDL